MKRNVTITSVIDNAVIPKKDGGSYTGLLITGTSNGKPYTRGIHPTGLTKYPGLKEKLLGLKSGETVAFVQEDEGFKNITDVTTDLTSDNTSYSKGGFKSKRGGMNLNDTARIARSTAVQAAAQLGTAKSTADLLVQAEDIATFIMSPLSVDSSGNTTNTTTTQETSDAFDDDTPF